MSKKKAAKFLIEKGGKLVFLIMIEGVMACGESWIRERKRKNYENIKEETGAFRNRAVTESKMILEDEEFYMEDIESDFEIL